MAHRYFAWLSYDGSVYSGWQIQPGSPTVQQTLNNALSILLREDVQTTGAGRTDAGVHATTFAAHFDTEKKPEELNLPQLVYKLNRILPSDIAIHRVEAVFPDVHARFSALSRTYHYYICTRKDPFQGGRSWLFERKLKLEAMQQAADLLTAYEDFESFSKINTQVKTFLCKISKAQWEKEDGMLRFEITADRFLRNMVRAIVGTLVEVGLGKITPNDFADIIESKDRSQAGYSAPACGLFLKEIRYPPDILLK
ncbi:MAG: tRNA pseudouridine(38-40) synthase TruA [Bacteroides sp.]|jgi:tRNA pseudouridine38-40 synthase|nr:tRNA pseudouridine(38-40) synthase TruA [Bacteroides sp.]